MSELLRPGSPSEAGLRPERIAHARDLCARWVKDGHTPSLSVCVARRGVVVLHEAWGQLRAEPDSPPLAPDSLFPLASVTKPLTATLLMQLVDAGELGLNRPVRDYLPELSGAGSEAILVHHLLTHTSGFVWHMDPPMLEHAAGKLDAGFELPPCPENQHPDVHRTLSLFWDAPRETAPGEVMIYSNYNYVLLGEILRRLTGRAIDDLARERLFEPLGMQDSHYVLPEAKASRAVSRALELPMASAIGGFPGIDSREMQRLPDAGGGVASTPLDMARFGQMILGRGRYGAARVLSPASVAAMTRDQIPGTEALLFGWRARHASWGYGWCVESPTKWRYFHGSLHPLGSISHPGAGGVVFWVDPAHELVGCYFEVCKQISERMEFQWNFDLFQNVISSAIEEES